MARYVWCGKPKEMLMQRPEDTVQGPADQPRAELSAAHCHYLYHNRFTAGPDYTITAHEHLYWHVEFVKHGLLRTTVGRSPYESREGDSILLPPQVPHAFVYRDEGTTVFSVKFELHGLPLKPVAWTVPAQPGITAIFAALDSVLEFQRWPSRERLAAVDHLLAAYVHLVTHRSEADEGRRISLGDMVKELVERAEGKTITVGAIAKELGFSETHVRTQFRGAEGIALKEFIDRHRSNMAVKYLSFSDMPIKEIVQLMEFPDPQCFSRFCKRMTGRSPKHIRRQLVAGTNLKT
jgi:AraC-like DNA-binding protein/quercetin dioxygenase-like cupin family protein